MMKRLVACLIFSPLYFALAQDGASPFAEPPPDESTPFFVSGGEAAEAVQQTELRNSPSVGYPQVRKGPDSMLGQMRNFFTGLVPPIKFGGERQSSESATLAVEPENPVLKDQRELGVTYAVRNNSKELTRLEFDSSQHIEILVRNADGKVIERWSDDRGIEKDEGIVVINPQERIEYQEKVSTRELRAGQVYSLEAALKSQPDYSVSQPVTPR
jgi:hypothetical protein